MPLYHFHLRAKGATIRDPEGTEFPNEEAARKHAGVVCGELLRHHRIARRSWRLDVHDNEGQPCFEVPFVSMDETLAHLNPQLRSSMTDVCTNAATLYDTIAKLRTTVFQVRRTLARSEGTPYLAAVDGVAFGD